MKKTFVVIILISFPIVFVLFIFNYLRDGYRLYRSVHEEKSTSRLMWDRYNNLDVIYNFLQRQAELHPSFVSTLTIGETYEGRKMTLVKLSTSGESKPAIWIDSNIHSCEWISGAVGTYIIDQLIYSDDSEINHWLELYDFFILPIANPDGYEYTFTQDRFWRKTRSNTTSSLGCKGVDLNRNFDYKWEDGVSSTDPCSDTYKGSSVFSEPETKAIADFLTTISDRLIFYLSLHSAGQLILIPTGFSSKHIPQYNIYKRISDAAADASSKRFSTQFRSGNVVEVLHEKTTGSSMDFVKEKFNTNLTLTYELRDNGQYYGHLLPNNQILASALEFMDGFKIIMQELAKGIPETDSHDGHNSPIRNSKDYSILNA